MNWKEHAHLFVNGKFKIMDLDQYVYFMKGLLGYYFVVDIKSVECRYIEHTYLVARRVDDMNADELKGYFGGDPDVEYSKKVLSELCKHGNNTQEKFIYLLSMGVYPFDQSDFETGEVIDINTL